MALTPAQRRLRRNWLARAVAWENGMNGEDNPFAALFGAGDTGDVWLPVPGQSSMFTNAAADDPADTNGDKLHSFQGVVNGLDLRAAADINRPTLNTDGTSWWVSTDGVNERMSVSYTQPANLPLLIAGVFDGGPVANGGNCAAVYLGLSNRYYAIKSYSTDPYFRNWAFADEGVAVVNGPSGKRQNKAEVVFNLASASSRTTRVDGVAGTESTDAQTLRSPTDILLFSTQPTGQNNGTPKCYALMVRNRLFSGDEEETFFAAVRAAQGL